MFLASALCALLSSPLQRLGEYESVEHVFTNVHVVPMTSDSVMENRSVLIGSGRILAIEDASYRPPPGVITVDGAGSFVMPALADMHAHVRADPESVFLLYLSHGVTTVRNMDAQDGWLDHVAMREALEAGRLQGPRYLVSGPVLNPRTLPSVEAVEPLLDRHLERGYDFVKVHEDLPPATYDALLSGAADRGLPVVGHAQRQRPMDQTLRLSSVAHAEEFYYLLGGEEGLADPELRRSAARTVAEAGTWVCPTLLVYRTIADYLDDERFENLALDPAWDYLPPMERRIWLSDRNEYRSHGPSSSRAEAFLRKSQLLGQLMFDFHEAGVPMILGTDAFGAVVPGVSLSRELALLVDVGLDHYAALRTATTNVAIYLNEEGQWGTIEPGKEANLILVGRNPLHDVTAVEELEGLYYRGVWVEGERLHAARDAVRARYSLE